MQESKKANKSLSVRDAARAGADKTKAQGNDHSIASDIKSLVEFFYIKTVPSYGNNFFFTIGIYLLEIFAILAITGIIMLVFGPYWWNLTSAGNFVQGVHLWAAEAFVTLIFVHLFVNLSTSAYKKKRIVWLLGSVVLLLVLLEFAFGVGVNGNFISQWNAKAGADLWNGLGLGYWVNPLNAGAVFGWHIAIIPLMLVILLLAHYLIVKQKGLSTPYRKDIPFNTVPADHKKMYFRMAYILIIILIFAVLFRVPYIPPLTIQAAAQAYPNVVATTFLNEFNFSSPTATYFDSIDPYTFSTRSVYVTIPYAKYVDLANVANKENIVLAENATMQNKTISEAFNYFEANNSIANALNSSNPLVVVSASLTKMAEEGVYEPVLQSESSSGLNYTFTIRFLSDTRILQKYARAYGLRTSQWGMLKVGTYSIEKVSGYWLFPYNFMELATGGISWWGDLQNGLAALIIFLALMFLPYIPYLRDLPDRLGLYKLFWNRFTVPELKKAKRNKK
ncbi:MAG: cytochrome b N-terminal domain-containing protein [Candidatus Marsarchaeota archaeon]|nr:cytochrome b N-terminal domain-containing protein [Candidatus Marsarchaeota archaeon]